MKRLASVSGGDPSSLIKKKVAQAIDQSMKGKAVPDESASAENISFPFSGYTTHNYKLSLTGGVVSSATSTVSSITEPTSDNFNLDILLAFEVTYAHWDESYQAIYSAAPDPKPSTTSVKLGAWSFSFSNFTFTVAIGLGSSDISVVVSDVSPDGLQFKIPNQSQLANRLGCVQTHINDMLKAKLTGFNFTGIIETGIKNALSNI